MLRRHPKQFKGWWLNGLTLFKGNYLSTTNAKQHHYWGLSGHSVYFSTLKYTIISLIGLAPLQPPFVFYQFPFHHAQLKQIQLHTLMERSIPLFPTYRGKTV